jgi:uncharacterized repeat protein (TIGR03803 family)
MTGSKFSTGLRATLVIFTVTLLMTSAWAAPREKVLHRFKNDGDGAEPTAGLIFDAAGNLYGTASNNGASGSGTAFELTPKTDGGWTEKVLHGFGGDGDGIEPSAGLIFDADGNLYSTTLNGGAYGGGTVFELTPRPDGSWKERVLHSFGAHNGKGGICPYAGLVLDAAGNLYGTTSMGGDGGGTVFELTPTAGGLWTEKVLVNFNEGNGSYPVAGLIFDTAGNLYGTTFVGGGFGWGTVFELKRTARGWAEAVLHSFNTNGKDGYNPYATLILDDAGNLYGTTSAGGVAGGGTVFELMPKAGGRWTEVILHSFLNNPRDGFDPITSLIFDSAGNLYGTTREGGDSDCDCGAVFELTPRAAGSWKEKVLYRFQGKGRGGIGPYAGLILDGADDLYGTTQNGGDNTGCGGGGCGVVFEITP